jgi:hypothetical protein
MPQDLEELHRKLLDAFIQASVVAGSPSAEFKALTVPLYRLVCAMDNYFVAERQLRGNL